MWYYTVIYIHLWPLQLGFAIRGEWIETELFGNIDEWETEPNEQIRMFVPGINSDEQVSPSQYIAGMPPFDLNDWVYFYEVDPHHDDQ